MATGNAISAAALDEPTEAELHRLQTLVRQCKDALTAATSVACLHAGAVSNRPICFIQTVLSEAARKVELAELEIIASSRYRRRSDPKSAIGAHPPKR